jgi:hypothetical protein
MARIQLRGIVDVTISITAIALSPHALIGPTSPVICKMASKQQ